MSSDLEQYKVLDEKGQTLKAADLIVGPPIDDRGFKYRTIILTIELAQSPNLRAGTWLTLADRATGATVFRFVVTHVLRPLANEKFMKVHGEKVLELPDSFACEMNMMRES